MPCVGVMGRNWTLSYKAQEVTQKCLISRQRRGSSVVNGHYLKNDGDELIHSTGVWAGGCRMELHRKGSETMCRHNRKICSADSKQEVILPI